MYTEHGASWKQLAVLKGSPSFAFASFGSSVAISGATAVVGALGFVANNGGRAYVFTKTTAGWKQEAQLKGSDTEGDDFFGNSTAISDSTVVVGAPYSRARRHGLRVPGLNRPGQAQPGTICGYPWSIPAPRELRRRGAHGRQLVGDA